ncbi:hypothetical protein HMPREF9062_1098 [Actinomyces sp. oral taxon 448 str. F0400]|nr:hypothetical protein HMPREF9062_1098 [Actinomyces sp. oral taxon 448 str. F0400]
MSVHSNSSLLLSYAPVDETGPTREVGHTAVRGRPVSVPRRN